MSKKEILTDLETALIEPDVFAVAHQQAKPDPTADNVANHAADRGGGSGNEHDRADRQSVSRPGIECGRYQHRLAGQGNTHTFQRDSDEKRPKTISLEQLMNRRHPQRGM